MKTRNELAHDYLCALLHSDTETDGPHADVAMAFALADEFLAACGEKGAQEREPGTTWIVERVRASNAWLLRFTPRYAVSISPEVADRLLAGRDRVKLAVRVVEDSES